MIHGFLDLKKEFRQIADNVLQNEGSIDDIGVPSHQIAGRRDTERRKTVCARNCRLFPSA
jgi:hypothetical protein